MANILHDLNELTELLKVVPVEELFNVRDALSEAYRSFQTEYIARSHEIFHSQLFKDFVQAELNKKERIKAAKKQAEDTVAQWAEVNLQVGDLVKFLGTKGTPWREVADIERTKHPEYHASRVKCHIIAFPDPDSYKFKYTGQGSVNGMEKIALVVRAGEVVFNRVAINED